MRQLLRFLGWLSLVAGTVFAACLLFGWSVGDVPLTAATLFCLLLGLTLLHLPAFPSLVVVRAEPGE